MAACTLDSSRLGTGITLSGGDLVATKNAAAAWVGAFGTRYADASYGEGLYFEVTISGTVNFLMLGVANSTVTTSGPYTQAGCYVYYANDGTKYNSNTSTAYGSTYGTSGDRIGVLLKNGKLYFRKNGTWQNSGDPAAETGFAYSGLTGEFVPCLVMYGATACTLHVASGNITGSIPTGAMPWDNTLTVTVTFVSPAGAAEASVAVEWAVFAAARPSLLGAPDEQGSATTNGSGVLSASYVGTGIGNGDTVGLLVSTTGGTAATQCKSHFMPVVIAVA